MRIAVHSHRPGDARRIPRGVGAVGQPTAGLLPVYVGLSGLNGYVQPRPLGWLSLHLSCLPMPSGQASVVLSIHHRVSSTVFCDLERRND
jgi:hypothetical protein